MSKRDEQIRMASLAQDQRFVRHIARVCHEVNRAYCQAIGDDSIAPWTYAPDWQQESSIQQVQFHLVNPEATPENSHESWLAEKTAAGWLWGEVKNPVLKTHPCMMPYKDLPVEQRVKDHLFSTIVKTLVALGRES